MYATYAFASADRLPSARDDTSAPPRRRRQPSLTNLPLERSQLTARFLCAFVDVRREAALVQRLAQLGAKKAAGRVTRDAGVVPVDEVFHHLGIRFDHVRKDREVVVIDDR